MQKMDLTLRLMIYVLWFIYSQLEGPVANVLDKGK